MDITLRPGTAADAEACGTICYEAFAHIAERHAFPPDFPSAHVAAGLMSMLLQNETIYSVIAERDGRIVGSNFLWKADAIAGVGPITVSPSVQDSRIGRRLMDDVLQHAEQENFVGVRLVQAGYHMRSLCLYAKLGFTVQEPLVTLQGPALQQTIPGFAVRSASLDDLEACNALCTSVHGFARGGELRQAITQGTARVVEHAGRVVGYTTQLAFFGHAVAEHNEALKALIADAPSFGGPGFLLPARNGELLRWCLAQGLRVVQPMTLMSLGLYQQPSGAFLPSVLY